MPIRLLLMLSCASVVSAEGSVSFSFTPGKLAELKILRPPASVCLLFAVPAGFKTGQVTGLGAKALALPPLTATKP